MESLTSNTNADYSHLIDIKMGTSTLTTKHADDPEKAAYRLKKDQETTSYELGFCICGYKTPQESGFKIHRSVTKENISSYLRKVFYNQEICHNILKWLYSFESWLESGPNLQIRGSSLLFVIDESQKTRA